MLLAQNRKWETSADFGGALKEIILQKYTDNRRVKRDGVTGFVEPAFSGSFGGGAGGERGAEESERRRLNKKKTRDRA